MCLILACNSFPRSTISTNETSCLQADERLRKLQGEIINLRRDPLGVTLATTDSRYFLLAALVIAYSG